MPPLPDERPRQSVANLIGRFEQQTKRQSIVPNVPPRTSSVTSQDSASGDAEKIEQKEKREWPPRPRPSTTAFSPSIADQLARFSDGGMAKSPPTDTAPIPEPVPEPAVAAAEPVSSPPEVAVPVLKPVAKRQSSIGVVSPHVPSTPSKTGRPSTAGGATRTPTRSSTKSPPIAYHPSSSTSATTPAKAATPKTTPAKPRPSSRMSHTTPAPLKTPSRPKTPSVRPKTPLHSTATTPATARPKTPSSGLFAPTAASLARARNVQSPVPTPVKKTASAGVLERLSKPTAASLNKARTPVPAVTTARGGPAGRGATAARSTTRGASTVARGTGVKARGAAATPAKTKIAATATKPPAAPEQVTEPEPEHAEIPDEPHEEEPEHYNEEPEALSSPVEAHEPESSESTLIDEPQHASAGLTDDPDVHAAAGETAEAILNSKEEELAEYGVPDTSAAEALEEVVPKPDETIAHEEGVQEPPATAEAEHYDEVSQVEEHGSVDRDESTPSVADPTGSAAPEAYGTDARVNGKTTPTQGGGTDLEDIINMLEAKPRPMSIASIPDEFDIGDHE
ncbi:hypothetical protein DAEQUDRAFT_767197 [Daedalea quercina L-15889]|uniref:Uncharacterized protein n=1 Tax=Daedalea quercina L-15889 TaxID=1314783 RepID=A0A165NWK1_9APHY|nr:hypothetical protein DAEQUDRAFT_767197 [Daedalea quercina L-15889]